MSADDAQKSRARVGLAAPLAPDRAGGERRSRYRTRARARSGGSRFAWKSWRTPPCSSARRRRSARGRMCGRGCSSGNVPTASSDGTWPEGPLAVSRW